MSALLRLHSWCISWMEQVVLDANFVLDANNDIASVFVGKTHYNYKLVHF